MREVSFLYYGMACFALTLVGLLLTVLEFGRGAARTQPPDRKR